MTPPLVLLGFGSVGRAVLRLSTGRRVVATTRDAARAAAIAAAGAEAVVRSPLDADTVRTLTAGADVIVSFPPDGETDGRVAEACRGARAIAYVSSTAVYGSSTGVVDDRTPAVPDEPRAQARLDAEAVWRGVSAVVLRPPGIYGPDSGLHLRLAAGGYRLPGDGSGVVSRIHVDDLAALLLAALERGVPGSTHLVGDHAPTPHLEVVQFLCERMGLPLPLSAPLSEVSPTLRRGRRVAPSQALAALGVALRYPTFRDGYGAILDSIRGRSNP